MATGRASLVHRDHRGAIYARHGTTVDTRLTVIDRVSGDALVPAGHAATLAELLALIDGKLPSRPQPFGGIRNGPAIRGRAAGDAAAANASLPFRPGALRSCGCRSRPR